MNLMIEPLRKYAQFQGRARRSEYWLFLLFLFGVAMVFVTLVNLIPGASEALADDAEPSGPAAVAVGLFGLGFLAFLIPLLAVTVRRLHDTNRTGWWILIRIIPFIGGFVIFVFTVLDGTKGANRFGPDPKGSSEEVSAIFA